MLSIKDLTYDFPKDAYLKKIDMDYIFKYIALFCYVFIVYIIFIDFDEYGVFKIIFLMILFIILTITYISYNKLIPFKKGIYNNICKYIDREYFIPVLKNNNFCIEDIYALMMFYTEKFNIEFGACCNIYDKKLITNLILGNYNEISIYKYPIINFICIHTHPNECCMPSKSDLLSFLKYNNEKEMIILSSRMNKIFKIKRDEFKLDEKYWRWYMKHKFLSIIFKKRKHLYPFIFIFNWKNYIKNNLKC